VRREIEFKSCSCGDTWPVRESFIRDADIMPIGITFSRDEPRVYYFFNHVKCESTLAIDVEEFADLIEEPIPSSNLRGARECPKLCRTVHELEACDLDCYNAPYRRFLFERLMKKDV
jgi:hypothetical protein